MLDGLRGVAILLVVCVHVGDATGVVRYAGFGWRLLDTGSIGVPLFFLLSGLLLYRPFARATLDGTGFPDVRRYFQRRALRILPAYWLVLPVAFRLSASPQAERPLVWLEFITLTHPYAPSRWWEGTNLLMLWSLSVEVCFYLLLPLLAWGMHRSCRGSARRLLVITSGLAVASVVWTAVLRYVAELPFIFYSEHLLPRSLVHFALGMALAVVAERPGAVAARIAASPGLGQVVALCGLALLSTPLATPLSGPQSSHQYLVATVLTPLVALAAVAPAALAPDLAFNRVLLGNRLLMEFGRISYGLFLWHMPVLIAWYQLTERSFFLGDFWLVLTVILPISILFSALSHDLVEQPFQHLGRRPGKRTEAPDKYRCEQTGERKAVPDGRSAR
ncbi:acyltransferase [Actinocorallia aurantiaca]|uniref:Acyltransferase n=1 Tax=Actinocorallia aurantiaca TaxID=46204 RepID=A0ABN3TWA1_9ACTN